MFMLSTIESTTHAPGHSNRLTPSRVLEHRRRHGTTRCRRMTLATTSSAWHLRAMFQSLKHLKNQVILVFKV